MPDAEPLIANATTAPEESVSGAPHPWASTWRVLTPGMRARGGRLGVVECRLKPGQSGCPFHWHAQEDEVFYVLSGRGVLRYGEHLRELGPGDCVSCPAGTRVAHQLGNPFEADFVYLAIGPHEPTESCGYPDSGKVMVRAAGKVGFFQESAYMAGEPEEPAVLRLWAASR